MADCIFCSIVAGELPSHILSEDEHTVSFLDINPWTRGHSLVVPRGHSEDLLEIEPADLCRTMDAAKELAALLKDRLGCDGINLLNSCGQAAWQTVFHFHVHVVPRYTDDPLQVPGRPLQVEPEELEALVKEIRG